MMSAVAVLLALLLVFSSIGSSAGCLVSGACPTGSDAGVSNCNRLEVHGACTTTSEFMSESMPFPGCAAPAVRVSTRSSCVTDCLVGCCDWQYFSTCISTCPAVVTDKCAECNAGFKRESDGSCVGCGAGSGPGSPFGSPCATCSSLTYKAHISGPDGINCIPVPVGSYRVSASAISLCDEGYTCAGGAAAQVKCHNADTPSGSATCTNCLASTYPVGVEGTASATCDTCPKGFACSGKTEATQSAPTKIACDDAGEWAAATGALACAPVPAGSYKKLQAGAETPSFLTVSGADVNSEVAMCPPGYTCAGGGSRPVPCDGGGAYASSAGTIVCLTVPLGSYKKLTTVTILDDAVSGTEVNSAVELCPTGYACAGGDARPAKCHNAATVEGSATCTNCLASTYPVGVEGAANATCTLCEKGFKCSDGMARVACSEDGVYAGVNGTLACAPVPAGSYKKLMLVTIANDGRRCMTIQLGVNEHD